uniref:Uncharacterized protein n=1 Tax=Siphoviridae sp. ctOsn3 TaxID=2823577 RepID=A0A8S5LGE3_9CAUD|nr:MAG TPA: hypothetical protein [Siphoviridae sp. ctOsn3]
MFFSLSSIDFVFYPCSGLSRGIFLAVFWTFLGLHLCLKQSACYCLFYRRLRLYLQGDK